MEEMMKAESTSSRVLIAGCACVIFSRLTPNDIRQFKAYHPEVLTMNDEKTGEPLFALDLDDESPGSLTSCGATFSKVTSVDGKATITVVLDPATDDPAGLVQEKLASPLLLLDRLENQLVEALPGLKEEHTAVAGMIRRV